MTDTDCTAVISLIPAHDNPEMLVQALEQFGGSLKKFTAWFPIAGDRDEQAIVSWVETWLTSLEDKKLLKRWHAAIKQNMRTRLTFLKIRALERLESLHVPVTDGPPVMFKVTEEVAFAKLVLGDLLAGEAAAAKRITPAGTDDDADDDDADLAEIMST